MLFWALLALLINCFYHLLHLNVCVLSKQIWFDLINFRHTFVGYRLNSTTRTRPDRVVEFSLSPTKSADFVWSGRVRSGPCSGIRLYCERVAAAGGACRTDGSRVLSACAGRLGDVRRSHVRRRVLPARRDALLGGATRVRPASNSTSSIRGGSVMRGVIVT